MSEMPDLEHIRLLYALSKDTKPGRSVEAWWAIRDAANAEFDRWLESIKADAWDEGHEAGDDDGYSTAMHEERGVGEDLSTPTPNPYRTTVDPS